MSERGSHLSPGVVRKQHGTDNLSPQAEEAFEEVMRQCFEQVSQLDKVLKKSDDLKAPLAAKEGSQAWCLPGRRRTCSEDSDGVEGRFPVAKIPPSGERETESGEKAFRASVILCECDWGIFRTLQLR